MSSSSNRATSVRYQPDESPPAALVFGCGLQLVIVGGAGIVLIPTLVIRAAGGSEAYLSWAVFSAVAISGVCTALQAVRVGRIGAGYVLAMGPPGAFIGLSAAALVQGGPGLLGTLVVASSLLPIVEFDMGPAFVGLLPAFLFVALMGAIQTIVSAVAIQRVSWRRPRAVDYRAVEGGVAADGVCKLLSGLAGIPADADHRRRQRAGGRADGRRGPRGRNRGGWSLDPARLPAQGPGHGAGDSGRGRRRLRDRPDGVDLRARRDGDRAGRNRSSQGYWP